MLSRSFLLVVRGGFELLGLSSCCDAFINDGALEAMHLRGGTNNASSIIVDALLPDVSQRNNTWMTRIVEQQQLSREIERSSSRTVCLSRRVVW